MNNSGDASRLPDVAKKKMDAVIEHLNVELKNIRTGRANPSILDSIMISVYGTKMRLKDVGTVSVPEPRQLIVTPFDANNVNAIAKAIDTSDLGFRSAADGNSVRVTIPQMDESIRKEMVKQCKKRCEDAKIGIRGVRRDCNELLKKLKNDKIIDEDMMHSLEKKIQDFTDKFCKNADEIVAHKEKEVLEV